MDQLLQHVLDRIAALEARSKISDDFPTSGIVSAARIQKFFRISAKTLLRWERLGLKRIRLGTKATYFLAEDILELCRQKSEQVPEYKSLIASRIEAKKKGATT